MEPRLCFKGMFIFRGRDFDRRVALTLVAMDLSLTVSAGWQGNACCFCNHTDFEFGSWTSLTTGPKAVLR